MLADIPVRLSVEVGSVSMKIAKIMDLGEGHVVELDRQLNLTDQISFDFIGGDPFSLQVIDIDTGVAFSSATDNLALNGLHIPAPSSLALLGLGGLAVGRRRR